MHRVSGVFALDCVLPASHRITGASSAVCRIHYCSAGSVLAQRPLSRVRRAYAHHHRKFDRIMPGLSVLPPRTHTCSRPCASSHSSPNHQINSAFRRPIVHVECDSLADGRRQDLPTGEAENGMLLHLATMAPRERFELDAGVEIAASDLFGRNRDGPNTSPASSPNRFTRL